MSELAVDYSFDHPDPAQLAAHGVKAVGRYLAPIGPSTAGKVLTSAEAQALLHHGLDVFTIFEASAGNALRGAKQGTTDGKVAADQLHALGAPPLMAVYFAVDTDVTAAQFPVIGDYLDHARAELGTHTEGVYGEFDLCAWTLAHAHARLAFQTVAWSGGRKLAAAAIYQHAQTVTWGGGTSDVDEIDAAHWGGWRNSQTTPVPVRNPFRMPAIPLDCRVGQHPRAEAVLWLQWALGFHKGAGLDGILGPDTRRRLLQFKLNHRLSRHPDLIVRGSAARALAAVHR